MTWHAKALTTSYLTGAPRRQPRPRGERRRISVHDDLLVFPRRRRCRRSRRTRWSSRASAIRSPTARRRRSTATIAGPTSCRAACTRSTAPASSVVNAGIGGNRVASPARYSPATPVAGGPSALERFDRDVAGSVGRLGGDLARRDQRPVRWGEGGCGHRRHAGDRRAQPRARPEDLRRDDRVEPRQRDRARHARRPTPSVRRSTRSSAAPGRSTASSTSTWRRAIRRPAACARPSSPTARPAGRAIDCIRTGPAIRRWGTPSISRCFAPLFGRR